MGDQGDRIERLEKYTHFLQNITLSLGTLVITALAYDRIQTQVRLGGSTIGLFLVALVCFLVSGLSGGHVAAQLAVMDDTRASDILEQPTSLVRAGPLRILTLKLGQWRSVQHWALVLAIGFACSGGLVVVDNGAPSTHQTSSATASRNGT